MEMFRKIFFSKTLEFLNTLIIRQLKMEMEISKEVVLNQKIMNHY
jgi:hypothetical protein